jgi:hypothetical protein
MAEAFVSYAGKIADARQRNAQWDDTGVGGTAQVGREAGATAHAGAQRSRSPVRGLSPRGAGCV